MGHDCKIEKVPLCCRLQRMAKPASINVGWHFDLVSRISYEAAMRKSYWGHSFFHFLEGYVVQNAFSLPHYQQYDWWYSSSIRCFRRKTLGSYRDKHPLSTHLPRQLFVPGCFWPWYCWRRTATIIHLTTGLHQAAQDWPAIFFQHFPYLLL